MSFYIEDIIDDDYILVEVDEGELEVREHLSDISIAGRQELYEYETT